MAGPQISLPLQNDLNLQGRTLLEANFAWDTNNNYGVGDLAHHNGSLYRALITTPVGQISEEPGTTAGAAQWAVLAGNTPGGGTRAQQEFAFSGAVQNIAPDGETTQYTVTFSGGPSSDTTPPTGVTDEQFIVPVRTGFVNGVQDMSQALRWEIDTGNDDIDGEYEEIAVATDFDVNMPNDTIIRGGSTNLQFAAVARRINPATPARWLIAINIPVPGNSAEFNNGLVTRPRVSDPNRFYVAIDSEPPTGPSESNFDISAVNVFVPGETITLQATEPFGDSVTRIVPNAAIQHSIVVTDNRNNVQANFSYTSNPTHNETQDRQAILQGLVTRVNSGFALTGASEWTLDFQQAANSTIDTNQSQADRYSIAASVTYTPAGNGENAELTFNETAGSTTTADVFTIVYNGANSETDRITQLSNDAVDSGFITYNVDEINSVARLYSAAAGSAANTIVFTSAAAEDASMTFTITGGSINVSAVRTRQGALPVGPIVQASLTVDGTNVPVTPGESAAEVATAVARYVDNSDWIGHIRGNTKAAFTAVEPGSRDQLTITYTGEGLTFTDTFTDGT